MNRPFNILPCILFILITAGHASGLELKGVKPVLEFKGSAAHPLSKPTDFVVTEDGLVYILDGVNHRVNMFDPAGRLVTQFGRKGKTGGGFDSPVGIGIDKTGLIYICDTGGGRIVIYSREGSFLRDFTLETDVAGARPRPVDIIADEVRRLLYISDNANHAVLVYTKKGEYLKKWGTRGGGAEEFRYPATLALKDGKLYITDVLGTRVQVIDTADGKFVRQIGHWGVLPGELFRPKGVALDGGGLVYISDSYMDVIQVFSGEGDFMYVLGDGYGKIRRFTSAATIYIDGASRLYVAEVLKNRVGVYSFK